MIMHNDQTGDGSIGFHDVIVAANYKCILLQLIYMFAKNGVGAYV